MVVTKKKIKPRNCIWVGDLSYIPTCNPGRGRSRLDIAEKGITFCPYCGKRVKFETRKI